VRQGLLDLASQSVEVLMQSMERFPLVFVGCEIADQRGFSDFPAKLFDGG
jgi:hypothetical protein